MKRRFVIYAEKKLGLYSSKTGNCAIRYFPEEVVAVIDSSRKGQAIEEIIGVGRGIPIVADLDETLRLAPNTFLVGSAPVGGRPDAAMLETIKKALRHKMNLVSGLHHFFSDMPELADLAKAHGATITDLRKPSPHLSVSKSKWKDFRAKVVLTVGSDCNCGKLSTVYEVYKSFLRRNIPSEFIGTGQTGILLGGGGVPVDAVVSDFMAGAMEAEIEKAEQKGCDFIFVEGQGALTHSAYSGVTLGLLHGSMPDAMIFCHDPTRMEDDWGNRIPDIKELIRFNEECMKFFKPSKVAGLGIITRKIAEESEAKAVIQKLESETGIPANDPYRFGCENIVEGLIRYFGVKG